LPTISQSFKLRKIFFTATAGLLALFFAAAPLAAPVSAAGAGREAGGSYIVKLSGAEHFGRLEAAGKNISRRFLNSENPEFQNIYTFTSDSNLPDLKGLLAGGFDYLETQKTITAAAVVVNDPGFTLDAQNIDKQWALPKTGFNDAWQKTIGSKSNVVAIIDTGIDQTHEDLQAINYLPGFDFISSRPILAGSDSDDNGHGTLVTGVLGATVNNGLGIAGTNWEISVIPLKTLDSTGRGSASALAEAVVWAADNGAQFINLSVGGIGFGHDTTLANAITYAFNKNIVIVAAAGNDVAVTGGSLDSSPVFPICDDNNFNMVIGVAATDQNDIKPEFSNYGKNCIDVTAPGKRILSTINFDPLSKKPSRDSYAYTSGTSLAVPFVVGQAALIKALYPLATNIQIRDRIITTADPVDNLSLSQCNGGSCRGLLGAGRINVLKSLETAITPDFLEGDLVKVTDLNGAVYQIVGGQKRLVSSFVYNQRFSGAVFKTAVFSQLSSFPDGPYVTPLDGTLVKYDASPTVYIIQNGKKMPITYTIFQARQLSFAGVNTLSFPEMDSWITGNFYPPVEGTLLKTARNKTVYWTVGEVIHPISYNFFVDKGLNIFPILIVPDADIEGFAKGEAYIR
jgi:hypothetical protein